jgi:hypothetical protein
MRYRSEELAAKRQRLIAKVAVQRVELAHQMQPWRERMAVADKGISVVRTAGRHPLLLAGAALLLAVWRPRRTVKVLQYGWLAWQLVRELRAQPLNTTPLRQRLSKFI